MTDRRSTAILADPEPAAGRGRPPGPSKAEFARIALTHRREAFELLPRVADKYGDVVDLPIPTTTVTLLSHPDHVDHVFTRHHDRYSKPRVAHELMAGEPAALPLLEGEEWKRVRREFNPHFAEKALAQVTDAMVASVVDRVDSWGKHVDSGEYIDLEHELGAVVMSALLSSMFHFEADEEKLDRWVEATVAYGEYVVARTVRSLLLPNWVPQWRMRKGEAAKAVMQTELDALIAARVHNPSSEATDVLDVLLGMPFEGAPEHQYARMRAELSGLVFAGFDTTAEALAWTVAFLGRTPEALGKAYAEVDALKGAPLEYAHVAQLPYLRACFDEAQRLQAAPMNVRTALTDDVIGGFDIPEGSHVVISPYGLQRDPRFWNEPEVFNPGRFSTDQINRNAFIPFSIGPRKCMGTRMAYIDGVLTLAAIMQRYTFVIRDGWTPRHVLHVSIGLDGGLPVRLHAR